MIGIFKNLEVSGFDKKAAAEMIGVVKRDDVDELVQYASLQGIVDKLEVISGLFEFLVMVKDKYCPQYTLK